MYKYLIGMVNIGSRIILRKDGRRILSRHVQQWQLYQLPGFLWDTASGHLKGSQVSLSLAECRSVALYSGFKSQDKPTLRQKLSADLGSQFCFSLDGANAKIGDGCRSFFPLVGEEP